MLREVYWRRFHAWTPGWMRALSWRGGGWVVEVIVILSQSSSGSLHRQLVPPELEPGDDAAACSGNLRRQRLRRGR